MDSLSLNKNGATPLGSRISVVGSLQLSPPAQVLKCGKLVRQVAPPSWLAAVSRPLAPPLDQRSCCHTAMMLPVSVGLISTQGSTSLLRKFTPGCPEMSQPAKGLATDTTFSGLRVNGAAVDGATMASV